MATIPRRAEAGLNGAGDSGQSGIDWCQDHVDREAAEDTGLQRELGRV